jgi:hypothetical protein
VKFSYSHPSGYSHAVRTFVYKPNNVPTYCWYILLIPFTVLNLLLFVLGWTIMKTNK